MAEAQASRSSKIASYEAYFEKVQSRKKIPESLQEILTAAFARIPVSSFPEVPGGKGMRNLIFLSDVGLSAFYRLWSCSS
jgi:hypothetical protein